MDTNVFTIDFETVAPENYFDIKDFSDIWQIGITRVSDGETKVWNVKPHEKHYSIPFNEWFEYRQYSRNTKSKLSNEKSLADIYPEIIEFIGTNGVLIAHNAFGFDKPAWEQTLKLHNLDITNHIWLDTKHEYAQVYPDRKHRLKNMVEEYTNLTYDESKDGDAHDAGWDSNALYEVYKSITQLDVFDYQWTQQSTHVLYVVNHSIL